MEPCQTPRAPSTAIPASFVNERSGWSSRPSNRGKERYGAVTRVAHQLGIGTESLRGWVRQAEIDGGRRSGVTTADQRRIAELERENRELRRANEILRTASAFFARELDPRPPR